MALTLTACNQTADTRDADLKAIQDNETLESGWAAKDHNEIMSR
jgi:hypothetical protein